MNEKSKAILAGFTGRKKRSQLTPYRDLICKLHQRGCTFREIVHILSENYSLTVAHTTVIRFVARLEKECQKPHKIKPRKEKSLSITQRAAEKLILKMPFIPPITPKSSPPVGTSDEIRRRITAFKQQSAHPEPDNRLFEYDPDKPLHLLQEDEKT